MRVRYLPGAESMLLGISGLSREAVNIVGAAITVQVGSGSTETTYPRQSDLLAAISSPQSFGGRPRFSMRWKTA